MNDEHKERPSWRNRERRRQREAAQRPKEKSERLVHRDKTTPIKIGDGIIVHLPSGEQKELRVTAQTPEYVGKKKGDLVLVNGAFQLIEHAW